MFLCRTVVLVGLNCFVSVTKEQKVQSTAKIGRSVTMAHFFIYSHDIMQITLWIPLWILFAKITKIVSSTIFQYEIAKAVYLVLSKILLCCKIDIVLM